MAGLIACPGAHATEGGDVAAVSMEGEEDRADIIVTGLKPDQGQNKPAASGALGSRVLLGGRTVAFAGNVNNLLNEKYWARAILAKRSTAS